MLTPERWQLVERIFHEAAEMRPDERAAFVASSCAGDEELAREVTSLLEAESGSTSEDGGAQVLAAEAAADWAASSGEPLTGREIDGYSVKALLGRGGMGETWLAEDSGLGRQIALKLLPKTFSQDARRVRRFIEEARAASALNHPGIVTVYGAGIFEGQRYIATEFIDGETVRQKLARGSMPAAEALDIAIQTAAALEVAHDAGIVHRDIKPENIMIRRRDGYVKIIDFGLAKAVETEGGGARSVTRLGDIVGTVDYMAPEQAAGGAVDARADLYSLTVVLYEMLTGRLPRELDTGSPRKASGTGQSGKAGTPVSAAVLRVIRRGVAGDPAARYQTIGELRQELESLRGSIARPHRRAQWIGVAAVALLGIAFGVYRWAYAGHGPNSVSSLVVMPLTSLGAADQAHLEEGMTEAIITRLSGLRQLRVPPAAAIRKNEDPFDAARRLGMDAVLTGSVQRVGDHLRVTAQLSRASDRGEIWAKQYDENFTGIFGIQDAIAGQVAASLVKQVSPTDRAALTRHETPNPEAYDLYLRARDHWALRTPATIRTAIQMYQQAIALQPDFALAYAGLADCYNLAASGLAPLTRAPLAKAAAEKAVSLDPESAEAHTALAFMDYKFEWKWDEADREFRRAIELNPRYTLAHHWYGEFLKLLMRHDESIRQFQEAVKADPFSIPVRYDYILALLNARRVPAARALLNETVAIDAESPRVLTAESEVLAAEGHPDESMEARLRSQLISGDPENEVKSLRAAYQAGGMPAVYRDRIDLIRAREKLAETPAPLFATALADNYVRVGDRDPALFWLTKATDLHEDEALLMKAHMFDYLRDDPEFIALEKRVGFLP